MTEKPICDADGFSRVLLASGLVDETELAAIVADFRSHAARDPKYGASLTAFTTYLVAKGIITCWQCAKLRNGQYKGFFLDGYKMLDHLRDDERCNRYLVEDSRTGQCVVLCVVPTSISPQKTGNLDYWIEEFRP